MKITEKLIEYYSPYFKSRKDLEKAFIFEESAFDRNKNSTFIKSAVERHSKFSLEYNQDATGVIYTDVYEIHFAILPTGDFAYYTVNKKTNRKGNYNRAMQLETIYNHLIKLRVLDDNVNFMTVFSDAIFTDDVIESFSKQESSSKGVDLDDWVHLSINSSMSVNEEFFVIDGSSQIMISSEEVEEEIGYIHFKVFNTNRLNRFQLWEAADASSGDEEWLMTMFMDIFNEKVQDSRPKVLMLNMISVKPVSVK